MTPDLNQMTTTELKQYISVHRNDEQKFHAALAVMMTRRGPSFPAPLDMADAEATIAALLLEQLKKAE
jgi:cation transport regulator ChaC